jgi:hypothetical protein
MAHLIINGTTFSGLPDGTGTAAAWQPTGYTVRERKIGMTLVAADGTRNRVERNTYKREWELTWEKTNLATAQALRTIQRLMTTWTFVDFDGASYTVQTEDEDFEFSHNFISSTTSYWDVTLKIMQV